MSHPEAETEMAAHVVSGLQRQNWMVSQEVQLEGGDRVDIVAERGPKVWAICAKLMFGLEVLEQCFSLHRRATLVSAAVPKPSRQGTHVKNRLALCSTLGIGVLFVGEDGSIQKASEPAARTPSRNARIQTREEQRTGEYAAAGSPGGGHHTPANETKLAVLAYIEEHPRCGINPILADVAYHYGNEKTARHQIQQMLKRADEVEQFGNASNARYLVRGAA